MILPTCSEEYICKELQNDYSWVKRQIQKMRKKKYQYCQKRGLSSKDYTCQYSLVTPHGNSWYIAFILNVRTGKMSFSHCHCMVESAFGSLDYYLWRGHTFGGEYFIRVTSHVIKRIKERLPEMQSLDSNTICSVLFQPGECGTGLSLIDLDFLKIVERYPDKKDICLLVVTMLGVFFAYHTPGKNVIFKTFISPDMIREGVEQDVSLVCLAGHMTQNDHLFSEEDKFDSDRFFTIFREKYKHAPCFLGLFP